MCMCAEPSAGVHGPSDGHDISFERCAGDQVQQLLKQLGHLPVSGDVVQDGG